MNETELGAMIVRLMGDGSSYQSMLSTAESAIKQTAKQVESATKVIEAFGGGLKSFAANALGALAVFGVATSAQGAFDKFADREKTLLRLTAAIESNGRAVGPVMKEYMAFADAVSAQTLTTKSSTLSMLKQVEAMGFSGDAAKRVIANSIAMAAVNDGSAENYIRVTAAMEQGNLQLLRRIPGLRGIKDQTELVTRAQQMLTTGMKIATADAESTSGQIEHLKRSLNSLSIEVGGLIAQAIRPLVVWLRQGVDAFNALDPTVKKTVVAVVTALGAIVSFGPMLTMLAPVLKLLGLLVGAVFSPWTAGLLIVGAVVAVVVKRLGGIEAAWKAVSDAAGTAWEWITRKTGEFVTWVRPVTLALQSFFATAWQKIEQGITDLWTAGKRAFAVASAFVAGVWRDMVGHALPSWEQIRDAIRDTIIVAEYGLRNLEDVARLTWLGMRYGWTVFSEEFTFFFTGTLPVLMAYFRDNWGTVFDWLVDAYAEASEVMQINAARLIGAGIEWIRENWETVFLWLGDAQSAVMKGMADAVVASNKASLTWLSNNWQTVLKGISDFNFGIVDTMTGGMLDGFTRSFGKVFDKGRGMFSLLSINAVSVFAALPDLISGKTSFKDLWKGLGKDYDDTVKDLKAPEIKPPRFGAFEGPTIGGVKLPDFKGVSDFKIPGLEKIELPPLDLPEIRLPKRAITDLENEIWNEFTTLWEDLGVDFKEFRDTKLREFAANIPESTVNQTKREMEKLGGGIGSAFAKGISEKFDAALSYSAEAITRIAEYRDKLDYGLGGDKARQGIYGGGAAAGRFDATQKGGAEGAGREAGWKAMYEEQKKTNELLRERLGKDAPPAPAIIDIGD